MAIIQKRADELKRGDMLADGRIVTNMKGMGAFVVVHCIGERETSIYCDEYDKSRQIDVESPDLTPAQQHAEELAKRLWAIVDDSDQGNFIDLNGARALLDKIKPPEPPTLAEALDVVLALTRAAREQGTVEAGMHEPISNGATLLDRARRAKLI